jgi:hypothetical protein
MKYPYWCNLRTILERHLVGDPVESWRYERALAATTGKQSGLPPAQVAGFIQLITHIRQGHEYPVELLDACQTILTQERKRLWAARQKRLYNQWRDNYIREVFK